MTTPTPTTTRRAKTRLQIMNQYTFLMLDLAVRRLEGKIDSLTHHWMEARIKKALYSTLNSH